MKKHTETPLLQWLLVQMSLFPENKRSLSGKLNIYHLTGMEVLQHQESIKKKTTFV